MPITAHYRRYDFDDLALYLSFPLAQFSRSIFPSEFILVLSIEMACVSASFNEQFSCRHLFVPSVDWCSANLTSLKHLSADKPLFMTLIIVHHHKVCSAAPA